MLKLKGKLASYEIQKTQTKLIFTFPDIDEDIELDLKQYEGTEGFILFHTDRHRMEIIKLLEAKKSFIDDLGNSPSKKMMIALKNRWLAIKDSIQMTWEEYYPFAIDRIIDKLKNEWKTSSS